MSRLFAIATTGFVIISSLVSTAMAGEQQRLRDRDRPPPGYGDRDRDRPPPGVRPGDDRRYGPGDWELIGEARIDSPIERESIDIDPEAGRFGRIGFQIENSDIELVDMEVEYGNGQAEKFGIGEVVKAGGRSKAYELGRGRRIRDITVAYRSRGPAKISVYGEPDRISRPGARWEALGCQKVGFLDDRDVIRVGRDDGRFRAIKLTVDGNKVRLVRLRVIYGNGQAEDLAVRTVIPEGTETRPFELTGSRRGINRIELQYLPQINFGGRATVCAFGL